MKKILATLCLVYQHPKILLGMKKRGFGVGRWNGFGGKVKEEESIEKAAKREVLEESGLKVKTLSKKGVLDFEFKDETENIEVHVFKIADFIGEPVESEEMKPQWFSVEEIPFDKMWPDDKYWLPYFLEDKNFYGRFLFDHPSGSDYTSKILEREIKEI